MNRNRILFLLLIVFIVLSSCTPGINNFKGIPDQDGEVAGFLMGIWHGVASPFLFIISLFNKSISIYEIHNNGNWYNLGFLFGVSIIFGGSGSGASRRKCR